MAKYSFGKSSGNPFKGYSGGAIRPSGSGLAGKLYGSRGAGKLYGKSHGREYGMAKSHGSSKKHYGEKLLGPYSGKKDYGMKKKSYGGLDDLMQQIPLEKDPHLMDPSKCPLCGNNIQVYGNIHYNITINYK